MTIDFQLDQSVVAGGLGLAVTMLSGGVLYLWRERRQRTRAALDRAEFVSNVSHELKAPITTLRLYTETLRHHAVDPATNARYLDTMSAQIDRLTRIIANVLDDTRVENGLKLYQFAPSDLCDVVTGALSTVQSALAQAGFECHQSLDKIPSALVDRDALEQAIVNLVMNAMKYSGDARSIEVCLSGANGTARIAVTDHGMGVEPEDRDRIFDRFVRCEQALIAGIPGSGLGLSLVRHIAEGHGGRAGVVSEPGQGSTFFIDLPYEVSE